MPWCWTCAGTDLKPQPVVGEARCGRGAESRGRRWGRDDGDAAMLAEMRGVAGGDAVGSKPQRLLLSLSYVAASGSSRSGLGSDYNLGLC
jgi:hypothetical protein